jgi:hypothetical protein
MNQMAASSVVERASTTTSRVHKNATTTSVAELATITANSQPSIIVYFSSHQTIIVGYDNVPQPRHIAELPAVTMPRSLKDAEIIFQYYSSSIEQMIHLLGGANPNAVTASTGGGTSTVSNANNVSSRHFKNRYIILHDYGLYVNRYWKLAIMRIMYDVCNATYVSFLSTIQMIPFSIVSPSTAPSKLEGSRSQSASSTSTSVVLSVLITRNDAQCMIYANGHQLDYTYQSCDYNATADDTLTINAMKDNRTESSTLMVDDLRKRQQQCLLNSTSPLIYAIASCIEKCPVSIRKEAVQNIYFSGTILVHEFQDKVALLLFDYLTRDISNHTNDFDEAISTTTAHVCDDEVTRTSPNTTMMIQFTQLPINLAVLRPLAPFIAIIESNKKKFSDTSMNSTISTTELIPWLGVSIYSSYWQHHEQNQEIISTGRLPTAANELVSDGMKWIDVSTTLPNPWNKRN